MPDATRDDLEQAWKEREAEAGLLTAGGSHPMALALRVYSLEIRLKWQICRHLKLGYLPKACKTHDLSEIVILSGLWSELDDPANGDLRSNWDLLAEFSKKKLNDIRYLPITNSDSGELAKLSAALDDPTKWSARMAVKTSIKFVAQKIGDAIRTFAIGEGWDQDDIGIAGTFDEHTERIYLVTGSVRQIDERRWHSGIMNAIRKEFADTPGITSRLVLVVRNVPGVDRIYHEMIVGEDEIDITELF